GGGAGGSIRDAGGAFGKLEVAREEAYFKNLYRTLRKEMEREIEMHENRAREHKEAADRLKRRVDDLEKEEHQLGNQ
uniref:ATPase inhibitor, mitochondrial n=1 Tax=Elaeophora elaphi TaxID=1147741 RepID=A0A0R3RRQ5_9BILA